MRARIASSILVLALALAACDGAGAGLSGRYAGAGLILVSIDTLRADRLGCYGYERPTSRALDAFAAESVRFADAYSNSPKTASSHMTLFTSLLPTAHGVSNVSARDGVAMKVLGANRTTLAEVLGRAGYWNAAHTNGGQLDPKMGFARGFQGRYTPFLEDVSTVVVRAIATAAAAAAQPAPPFLFVHTYQVHAPYLPPQSFRETFCPAPGGVVGRRVSELERLPFHEQWLRMHDGFWRGRESFGAADCAALSELYDGEIAYTDLEIGRLLAALRQKGLLDRCVTVILSDHGEEFREHGDFEHDQLFREHLHVPLLVRLPDGYLSGTTVDGLASLADVMPTLLELLGVDAPAGMMGRSLVSAMSSGVTDDRPVLSEREMYAGDYLAALRERDHMVLFVAREGALRGYDAGERDDIGVATPDRGALAAELRERLAALFSVRAALDRVDAGGEAEIDPERLDELLRLGYAGGEAPAPAPAGTPLDAWPDAGS